MSQGDSDDDFIKSILREILPRFTNAQLVDIEVYKENVDELITDISSDPFTKIPLSKNAKIPKNGKLKIHVKIREPGAERDITAVASTFTQNGTLQHTTKVEPPEFDTLPHEADGQKRVNKETIDKVLDYVIRFIHLIISLMNALINGGIIKTH